MKNHGNAQPTWLDNLNTKAVPSWTWRLGFALLALIWLLLVASSWTEAQSSEPPGAAPAGPLAGATSESGASTPTQATTRAPASDSSAAGSDDYDFKWLDPDKKIYVLQNRRYTKEGHAIISLMGGPSFGNAYSNDISVSPRLAYYVSETWGFEAFYNHLFNSQNDNYHALISTGTQVVPILHQVTDQFGLLVHWVPFYAKINLFDTIAYFDWYFSAGAGQINSTVTTTYATDSPTQQLNSLGLFIGTGHLFSITQLWIARLDFTASFYRAPLTITGDQTWYPNYNVDIGFGIRL